MAQIRVTNLTFHYEGSFDDIFKTMSFSIDTNWKLGLVGRNGKGKTTFLQLLMGKHPYSGTIQATGGFDYFPYEISTKQNAQSGAEFYREIKPNCEEWRILWELEKLQGTQELFYRPFESLSHGERTKLLLAILFSGEHEFLLIDEPTNHLDQEARQVVKEYLSGKKGYILVSHDRDLLDDCIDHILVLNRKTLEIQSGNFSGWWENKSRRDQFEEAENQKHLQEIATLRKSVERTDHWAKKSENSKIGFDPVKEHDRSKNTRAYIGGKTKKMQKRVKSYQGRIEKEIQEKESLLQDLELPVSLKICPLPYHRSLLIRAQDLCIRYGEIAPWVIRNLSFELFQGERVFLQGKNGCGKSTFLRGILGDYENLQVQQEGTLQVGSGLILSYINQDTGFLQGDIRKFCENRNLDQSLLFAVLRQLDLERVQFSKNLEEYSEGQKKKVLIAASLITPAHLYIWDEPMNYIDIFSRMQIEELIVTYRPTMLLVDHDIRFQEKIATRVVNLSTMEDAT